MSTPKTCQAWSEKEKQAVQNYAKANPHLNWKSIQQWYEEHYSRSPGPDQSQISRWTNLKRARTADTLAGDLLRPEQKRHKEAKYPSLEAALFEWHQRMQGRTNITGLILQSKAHFFWTRLPMYSMLPEPQWSSGWLSNFKERHGIRKFIQHGEAASAPENEAVDKSMHNIQQILMTKEQHEIYNMDETGLFYRMTPDSSLTTENMPGFKKDKNRITAALCSNFDSSDKCPPWFIGKSKNPRAFTHINRATLNCHYRANKTAWMTTVIMIEWLTWFNNRMIGLHRHAILLLDNFSAHNCAVEEMELAGKLTNVQVIFFLPNITSKHQPMDQGIIRAWKAYYRRHMLLYLIDMLEKNPSLTEPHKKINLLHAVTWGVEAWKEGVKDSTIQNCFAKSKVKIHGPGVPDQEDLRWRFPGRNIRLEMEAIEKELETATEALGLRHPLAVEDLLDSPSEIVDNLPLTEEEIEESILQRFSPHEDPVEDEEETQEVELVSHQEALQILAQLQLYEMQQEDGLDGVEWVKKEKKAVQIRNLAANGRKKEKPIDMYFSK